MTVVTVPDCMMIGNVKLMVTSAAACDAQPQEHLGQKMSLVLMVVKLAAGGVVP